MSRPYLFLFLFAFGLGLAAGEFWATPQILLTLGAAGGLAGLGFSRLRLGAVVVLGLVVGVFRWQVALMTSPHDIQHFVAQSITVSGVVALPSYIDGTAQRFELSSLKIGPQSSQGKLLVFVPAIPVIRAGTWVKLTCEVNTLTARSKLRQWSHGIHAQCATRQVDELSAQPRPWRAVLGRWQERLLMYVRQQYNEPQASLLNGILIGNTDGMSDRVQATFQATGTTHIVALSGFNVTIIITLVIGWLVRVIGRRFAWLPALLFIVVFVILSGASASVTRAALMAIIVQIGLFIGRPISIGRLLAYTSLIMALTNPLIVFHDLGFQLSFLATIGLVVLSRPWSGLLRWVPERFGLRENLSTTLAAITMTEPLLLWRFARLSLAAPLVNVLVVPLIPVAMALGAVSLVGLWWPWMATWLVPVCDALLRLILAIIATGASLPNAQVEISSVMTIIVGAGFTMLVVRLSLRHEAEPNTRP